MGSWCSQWHRLLLHSTTSLGSWGDCCFGVRISFQRRGNTALSAPPASDAFHRASDDKCRLIDCRCRHWHSTASFRSSSSPFGSKTVLGSAPASSWSRTASGMRGSLRRGIAPIMPNLRTKLRIVPTTGAICGCAGRSKVRFWPRDRQRPGEHRVNRTLNANELLSLYQDRCLAPREARILPLSRPHISACNT